MSKFVMKLDKNNIQVKNSGYLANQFADRSVRNFDLLKHQFKKIPAIMNMVNEVNKEELFTIIIPPGYREKLENGLCFLEKLEDGTYCPTLKNSSTNKFEKHIRLGKPDVKFVDALDRVMVQELLTQVVMQMNNISEQISQVFLEFQNDRIALVESAQQQYIEAININDTQFKKFMLANVVKTAQDARAQLIKNFEEDLKFINEIPTSDENLKLIKRMVQDRAHFKDFDKELKTKTYNLHKCLEAINRASGIIAFAYQELGESNNIFLSLQPYKDLLEKLIKEEHNIKKLYDYSDIKIANVWLEQPNNVLKKIESLKKDFNDRNNKELIIELRGQNLIEVL